jgi:hypothetical protein
MLLREITRIQLGQPRKNNTAAFMDDYILITQEHPFNHKARIYNGAVLEVYPMGNAVHVSDVMTTAPRSGAGTAAVKFLTSLADRHRVKLELLAKAYSKDKKYITDTEQLANWYKKMGFHVDDEFIEDPDDLEGYEEINMTYFPK